MKNDSQLIAGMFRELRQFCRDTSLLLSTAEETFKRREWTPPPHLDKTCLYSGSYSLDRPAAWLPYRFFRSYLNPAHPHVLAFIAILIELPPGHEEDDGTTLLTAGALRYEKPNGWGKGLTGQATKAYRWHLFRADRDDTGRPILHESPFQWMETRLPQNWDRITGDIDAAVTLGVPLHEISDAAKLEGRVIVPLLAALQNLGEATEG